MTTCKWRAERKQQSAEARRGCGVSASSVSTRRSTSSCASAFAESVDDGFLAVTVHERGTVHVAGRDVPPDSVRAISTALRDTGRSRVLVQADKKVPTGLLLEVLDTCRLAGASQVDVAATEERP